MRDKHPTDDTPLLRKIEKLARKLKALHDAERDGRHMPSFVLLLLDAEATQTPEVAMHAGTPAPSSEGRAYWHQVAHRRRV